MSAIRNSVAILVLLFAFSAYCQGDRNTQTAAKLAGSAKGRITVAFVLTDDAVMIDFAGL
jgi:hypothetical protein